MGMLLTDASVPPASQISSTSSNLTSSQSANMTYITTSSASSPGPKLWDMKMFGYLAGSLLFGTIIMPLISGTLLRFVVKTYINLVPWFHLAFVFLGLLCLVFLDAFPHFVNDTFEICIDAAVIAVVFYVTCGAFFKRVGTMLHTAFLVVIVVCVILDWFVDIPISLAATVAWALFLVEFTRKYGQGRFIRKLHRRTEEM